MAEKRAAEISPGDKVLARWDRDRRKFRYFAVGPVVAETVEVNGAWTHIKWAQRHVIPMDVASDAKLLIE